MKRYAILTLTCILSLPLSGCGDNAQVTQLQQQLVARNKEIHTLRQRLDAAESAAARASQTLGDAQAQIGALHAQLGRVQAELEMLKKKK